jgi:hypothetical protein
MTNNPGRSLPAPARLYGINKPGKPIAGLFL